MTPSREAAVVAVEREWLRARAKFPAQSALVTIAAATEEMGELARAYLEFHFEPHKGGSIEAIRKEAFQLAVMALRVACDCDLEGSPLTPSREAIRKGE
jgi:hypothetical protein